MVLFNSKIGHNGFVCIKNTLPFSSDFTHKSVFMVGEMGLWLLSHLFFARDCPNKDHDEEPKVDLGALDLLLLVRSETTVLSGLKLVILFDIMITKTMTIGCETSILVVVEVSLTILMSNCSNVSSILLWYCSLLLSSESFLLSSLCQLSRICCGYDS